MSDNVKTEDTRERFEIELEENLEFKPIGEFKITTSSDLAALANEVFKNIFEDYNGIIFEPSGEPSFSLIFDHKDHDEDATVGVRPMFNSKIADKADVVERLRQRDNMYNYGAKYEATEDLKDAVEKLLVPNLYNGGKPRWGQIIADFSERSGYNIYNQGVIEQYTKVSGISAKRLVALLYGYKDEEGDTYDYEVRVLGKAGISAFNGASNNWTIQISRASFAEVNALFKSYGYNPNNSQIIRA